MQVFIQITAGADTGPLFNLSSDADPGGAFSGFESGVSKADLVAGYTTTAPAGATVIRVTSTGLCTEFVNIVLTQPEPPVVDCNCYLISSIQDPQFPELGTTFFYTDCNDVFQSVLISPNQISYVCSKSAPTYYPEDRGLVVLESDNTNCGGCPPTSTTTSTTTCKTYYELAGCLPENYAFTEIVPTLGTGQQYILPGSPDIFYTYTGSSVTTCTPPIALNTSIQATQNIGCP